MRRDGKGGIFVPNDKGKEAISYIIAFNGANLESLTTTYDKSFKVKFPTSLKHLTLYCRSTDTHKLNLRTLPYLESFECKSLFGVKSIKDLCIPNSVRSLDFEACGFEKLGNLKSLNKLKVLMVTGCKKLIDFVKCSFPDSLSLIGYNNCVPASKVAELYEKTKNGTNKQFNISDFSKSGESFLVGSNVNFPPYLTSLLISDAEASLELGSNLKLKYLEVLDLKRIPKLNLKGILASLPNVMFDISICASGISYVDGVALFPELTHLEFEYNNFENIFRTNIHELKRLSVLSLENNLSIQPKTLVRVDPFQLLSVDKSNSNIVRVTKENANNLHGYAGKTVNVEMQNLAELTLKQISQQNWKPSSFINYVYPSILEPIISQVSLVVCENLKILNLGGLDIQELNINNFPISLEKLIVTNFQLQSIKGNFENLTKLKNLDLSLNQINHSMLTNQKFPASLESLDLSKNKIDDLTCLNLSNCVNLVYLFLFLVTTQDNPKGAIELKNFLLNSQNGSKIETAVLSTTKSKVVFEIMNGVDGTAKRPPDSNDGEN
ncbi:uncharacterized protein KGF55_003618 [Candida pseudojiufengensis]|uniref:uncharacterized protein n=1 Tax=Candida pseudojiufengensis TaxID=497109 RepID=UPI00222567DA|nr:uncharacterized protein KGF55_003618 [Candida pseudojiufengensis]KAI5962542.1 hypothetical protein KGF55_003618 [Candida pseudojiufengensis]